MHLAESSSCKSFSIEKGSKPCHFRLHQLLSATNRGVAQPGSVLAWGASGRRFKSFRPDQYQ